MLDKLMEVAEKLVPKHFTADGSPAYLYVGDILKEKLEAVEEYKMNHRIDNMFRTFYAAVLLKKDVGSAHNQTSFYRMNNYHFEKAEWIQSYDRILLHKKRTSHTLGGKF